MRSICFLCTLVSLVTTPIRAQDYARASGTAYARTLDAWRVRQFCIGAPDDLYLEEGGHNQSVGKEAEDFRIGQRDSVCGESGEAARVFRFVASPTLDSIPSRGSLDAALASVEKAMEEIRKAAPTTGGPGGQPQGSGGQFLSFPAAAFAVTDFLIERAKAELVQSTFAQLGDLMTTGDLGILLPNSGAVLRRATEMSFRTVLPVFQASAREDLRALPINATNPSLSFYDHDENPRTAGTVPDGLKLGGALLDALFRMDGGENVFEAIGRLQDRIPTLSDPGLDRAVGLVARMAWEARAVNVLRGGTRAQEGLSDLMLRPGKGIVFAAFLAGDLSGIDSDLTGFLDDFWAPLYDIAIAYEALGQVLAGSSYDAGGPSRDAVVRAVAEVILATNLLLEEKGQHPALERGIGLAVDTWTAAEAREYSRIVVLVTAALQAELGVLERGEKEGREGDTTFRILAFAAAVASTEDGESLTAALEAFVDPVGSFRARRGQPFKGRPNHNISLVSYLGFSTGLESLDGITDGGAGYWGAFAPLGLELSRGIGNRFLSSIGLLASVADLGTLVSYRLNGSAEVTDANGDQDTVSVLPDVNLWHVFSPGIHLTLGLTQDNPFTVGIGYQLAPQLRFLEESEKRVTAHRLSVFFAVDLTLLRF